MTQVMSIDISKVPIHIKINISYSRIHWSLCVQLIAVVLDRLICIEPRDRISLSARDIVDVPTRGIRTEITLQK